MAVIYHTVNTLFNAHQSSYSSCYAICKYNDDDMPQDYPMMLLASIKHAANNNEIQFTHSFVKRMHASNINFVKQSSTYLETKQFLNLGLV